MELHNQADKVMDIEQISPSLEIDESPGLHKIGWIIQPYAWGFILIFIIAGLLGLFGKGFLSNKVITNDFYKIKYEKSLREGSLTAFEVHDISGSEKTVIGIPVRYLSYFITQSIVPEPSEISYTGKSVQYIFQGIATDKQVIFYLEPRRTGKANTDITINNRSFHISNFIFP